MNTAQNCLATTLGGKREGSREGVWGGRFRKELCLESQGHRGAGVGMPPLHAKPSGSMLSSEGPDKVAGGPEKAAAALASQCGN